MMQARPNLNGNTSEAFLDALNTLALTTSRARAALNEVRCTCTHGRNYQTVQEPDAAREADLRAVAAMDLDLRAILAWTEKAMQDIGHG